MGSVWTLHSMHVGALSWLLLWALFSLLSSVFSDVLKNAQERKEQSLEGGVVKEENIITGRLSDLGIDGVHVAGSSLHKCVKLADSVPLALQSGGEVVIGGLFPLHYVAPKPQHSYRSTPQFTPCSG